MLPEDDQGIKTLIRRHNGEIERQVGKTPQRWHFSGNLGNGRGQRDQAEGDWRRDGGHPQSCNPIGDGPEKGLLSHNREPAFDCAWGPGGRWMDSA